MKTFEYKGFNEAGRASRGLIEALDVKEAREKLAHRGVLAERVTPAGEGIPAPFRRRTPFPLEARAMVYQELAALVAAGLPLAQALEILIGSPELGESRTVLARVRDRIGEGASLAGAIHASAPGVTPFEEAVVEAGERAGELPAMLQRLATFLEEQKSMRESVATALLYPAIVFMLALVIGMGVLGIMVPRMGRLFEESDVALPALTTAMMNLASLFGTLFVPGLVIACLAAFLTARRMAADPLLRRRANRWMFRLPLAGRAYTAQVNLRFARTLALLTRGGVTLVEGMALAGRATGSSWVATLAEHESEQIRQGSSLADAVRRIPPLQTSLPGWIEAGEASGDLSGMLESAAARYQRQWERLVSRFLALLEPVLVLAIGGFVLLVALSILMPVLSMNSRLL